MLNLILNFIMLWLIIDALIVATTWYAVTVIKPRYPNWWKQVVVDVDPEIERVYQPRHRQLRLFL